MKKIMAVALSVVLLTSSAFIVLCNQSDADPANPVYQYAYDGYTLTQTDCVVDEGNSIATVSYSIVGENYSGTYTIVFPVSDGKYTFKASNVTGTNPRVVMIPPVIKYGDTTYTFGSIAATANENSIGSIEKLYIFSNGANITLAANSFQYAVNLTNLTIEGNVTAQNRPLRDCSNVRDICIDGIYHSTGTKLITGIDTNETILLAVKTSNESNITNIVEGTVGGIILQLLPGSQKAKSIDFNNVLEVKVCANDWQEGVTVNDLVVEPSETTIKNAANGLSISRYSDESGQPSFNIAIAQGQSGVAVDKGTATENETVTITLSPEQGKQVASVSVLKDNNDAVQATVNPQNANQYTFTMPASNVTVSATFEDIPPATYNVVVDQNLTGIAVDKGIATENETVTITLSPEQGKQVASVSVLKDNNDAVQATVNPQNANQYTFTMPASNVTVSATFEDVPSVSVTPSVSTLSKGDTTVITVSAVNLKNVKSMNFVITYDSEKFTLKSPEYATLLENAALAGDLTQGQYVVAFSTSQNISGDLLTFQLEAKSDAALGDSLVRCTVQLNGRADGNGGNIVEATYSAESTITIGNILGDLDSDGDVDEDDAVYLLLHTFRASEYVIPGGQSVDYDGDGDVDSDDAIWLKNHVTDPTHYPLTGGA